MTLVSCQTEIEELSFPKLVIDTDEMTFDVDGGTQSLEVASTRDWTVSTEAEWIAVTPEKGRYSSDPQNVTVTVLENTGMDREASVKFTINMTSKYLTVKQAGPQGSPEQLILYYNDYDKEAAEKTYGSGSSYPYLDQFDGWKNEKGSGADNVSYSFKGMSARSNSNSNSNYSDYPGSGVNNMFFGANAYLATKNIALNGNTDLTLTFGAEKYSQDNGSVFKPSEFHIYLSQDGDKWVEFTDYTFAGGTTEGRWNVASASLSVPAGTENLSICMKTDVASSYRMDDLKLEVAFEKGTAVDFTNAKEMDFSANSSGGGNTGGDYANAEAKTVKAFIEAADENTYYKLEGTVSGFNAQYCSFDLTDETGKIYVYSVDNKSEWSSKISNGGKVVLAGKYLYYANNSKHEVVNAYILSFSADGGGNDNPEPAGDYIYFNDYDKAEATKTFGSGSSYPYLDQFDGWQNAKGPGAANVTYSYNKASARSNSTSNGTYSDYSGSGMNNIFFAADAYFATKNIALGGAENLVLTFGVNKYAQGGNNVMKKSEFHIYLSNNGSKWVELTDYTPSTSDGRWNVVTAKFSVPSGTENLSICLAPDVASVYRIDDFTLAATTTAGTSVDFSKAVDMNFGPGTGGNEGGNEGGNTGGNEGGNQGSLSGNGTEASPYTVADVLKKYAESGVSDDIIYVSGIISEFKGDFPAKYNSADVYISDDGKTSNQFFIFHGKNFGGAEFAAGDLKVGDKVVFKGKLKEYNGAPQLGSGELILLNGKTEGGNTGGNEGGGNEGGDEGGNEGTAGQYDPQGITWTLGVNAYDNTSGQNAQTAVVNGVAVNNLLKLGTGSKVGDATLHVPAGTKKIGAYVVAWRGKKANLKFSVNGAEKGSVTPRANDSATGNPPYPEFTLTTSDYYEIEVNAAAAMDVKVETTDPSNGRVLIFGLKAIK